MVTRVFDWRRGQLPDYPRRWDHPEPVICKGQGCAGEPLGVVTFTPLSSPECNTRKRKTHSGRKAVEAPKKSGISESVLALQRQPLLPLSRAKEPPICYRILSPGLPLYRKGNRENKQEKGQAKEEVQNHPFNDSSSRVEDLLLFQEGKKKKIESSHAEVASCVSIRTPFVPPVQYFFFLFFF